MQPKQQLLDLNANLEQKTSPPSLQRGTQALLINLPDFTAASVLPLPATSAHLPPFIFLRSPQPVPSPTFRCVITHFRPAQIEGSESLLAPWDRFPLPPEAGGPTSSGSSRQHQTLRRFGDFGKSAHQTVGAVDGS